MVAIATSFCTDNLLCVFLGICIFDTCVTLCNNILLNICYAVCVYTDTNMTLYFYVYVYPIHMNLI